MKNRNFFVATSVAILASIGTANATLITFTDQSQFESQLASSQTLDFNDIFYRPLPTDFTYGDTVLNADGGLYSSDDHAGGYLVGAENGGVINIQLAPGHNAFGIDIGFLSDSPEQEKLQYTLFGSDGILASNAAEPLSFVDDKPSVQQDGTFFGWISTDQDITGLSIYVYVPFVSADATIDNIIYDVRDVRTVPEPSTMLLFGIGLTGITIIIRRGKRSSKWT